MSGTSKIIIGLAAAMVGVGITTYLLNRKRCSPVLVGRPSVDPEPIQRTVVSHTPTSADRAARTTRHTIVARKAGDTTMAHDALADMEKIITGLCRMRPIVEHTVENQAFALTVYCPTPQSTEDDVAILVVRIVDKVNGGRLLCAFDGYVGSLDALINPVSYNRERIYRCLIGNFPNAGFSFDFVATRLALLKTLTDHHQDIINNGAEKANAVA